MTFIRQSIKQVAKMSDANQNLSYESKAIHVGQEYDQWSNLEIVPPIVTSMTYFQHDPTTMQVKI